ncbi:hypothetical protein M405DRAFT_852797 [Rhizopogon salebrosus TDB-379]|nr:hypothetical protein M405DRAFT_852797 [Rhizopogon salebrosus TDB-379]
MLLSMMFVFVSTILPFTSGSTHGPLRRESHQQLAKRARSDVGIHKRSFDNSRFTYYDVGLGACGQYNSPGDFIVALNVAQYGGGSPGPECFKSITITVGSKTTQATIMDECMGCPYGGLDFSVGLFNYFGGDGVIYGSWWFNDGSDQPTTSSSSAWTPTPTPTSTSTSIWTPTTSSTTSTTPTPTTSNTPTSSMSTSTSSTASTSSPTSTSSGTGTASGIAVPTGTAVVGAPGNPQNLLVINGALIELGLLLAAQRGN